MFYLSRYVNPNWYGFSCGFFLHNGFFYLTLTFTIDLFDKIFNKKKFRTVVFLLLMIMKNVNE